MSGEEPTESRAAQIVGAAANPAANKLELAGVFGLVAPLAATLGLFKATGSIGRIQRDGPTCSGSRSPWCCWPGRC